jgi:hypothetical protein
MFLATDIGKLLLTKLIINVKLLDFFAFAFCYEENLNLISI